MPRKLENNEVKKWMNYFLLSIPMAFLLTKVIEYKLEVIFWIYIAIMGITGLIARWNGGSTDKSKFVRVSEHICFVCTITIFLWWIADYFLDK